jgi:hypothetical protein
MWIKMLNFNSTFLIIKFVFTDNFFNYASKFPRKLCSLFMLSKLIF